MILPLLASIAKAIEFKSGNLLQVEQGSLYPGLHRLIKRGWISVENGTSETIEKRISTV
jgi:PadR family transcriptional regulator, regulatory protein PadR